MSAPLMPDVEEVRLVPERGESNCPFYGRYFVRLGRPFALLAQEGNQCALVVDAFSPCYMDIEGDSIDWRDCRRVAEIRLDIKFGGLG